MINLDIVIVTYNRLDKLKKTLSHYHEQTSRFRSLIVVDNCSTDGTGTFLNEWKKQEADYDKYIITLSENKGGSGGFYEGQRFAMSLGADWVYVADDDAYPNKDMISLFYKSLENSFSNKISAICAKIVNVDGSIAYEHRSRVVYQYNCKFKLVKSKDEDYAKPYFAIDLLSYVGSFLNAESLKIKGLVNPEYFIYADDGEHSLRLKQVGDILCVPQLQIVHDSGQNADKSNSQILVSWRDYYAIRNLLHMIKLHKPIAAVYRTFSYLRMILTGRYSCKEERLLIIRAIIDAWLNNLGKRNDYLPGWSIKK